MIKFRNSQLLMLISAMIFFAVQINAEVPQLINYQGHLTDSEGAPLNGEVQMTFTMYYLGGSGQDLTWSEIHTSVNVTDGLFNVQLGSITPLPHDCFAGDSTAWLGITIGEGPELEPRTRLITVPYAYHALRADTAEYVSGGTDCGWIDGGTVVRLNLESDSVGIGTSTPSAKLDVAGDMVSSGKATFGPGNTNTGINSFVLGKSNNANGENATISGGWLNTASGAFQSTVGGGAQNTSSQTSATVGGGQNNTASGIYSTIGGGFYNTADGNSATVSGGYQNAANGDYSYTAGYADTISASGDYSVLFGIGSKLTQDSTFMVDMPHVRIGNETDGFELPTIDGTSGQIMTTNGSGQVSWSEPPSGGDGSNWTESGGVLFTTGVYGLARFNSTVWGVNNDSTHINLGVHSTTGAFGFDYKYITIGGGYMNTASGDLSTIAGGGNNSASDSATVSGGYNNTASGRLATVGGGRTNLANGSGATIGGGSNNHASGNLPTVGGGYSNYALDSATVGGGTDNTAGGDGATVSGGSHNVASGKYATVGGGLIDTASGDNATVAGGWHNIASNIYATVSGGNFNIASGQSSTIGGGSDNKAPCNFGTISGGGENTLGTTASATIGGGYNNDALGNGSTVAGGIANAAQAEYTTVGGGFDNTADSSYSTVSGGWDNLAVANYAAIGGGHFNVANGDGAFIGAGINNSAGGNYAFLGGGQQNDVPGLNSVVGGGSSNTASSSASTVSGGSGNTASLTGATVCGGRVNTASGTDATVCGGAYNTAEEAYTFAAGHHAKALHNGSFVWSDNPAGDAEPVSSSANNQFVVRATGGIRFYTSKGMTSGVTLDPGGGSWTSVCDSTRKENIQPVDGDEILEKLAELEISRWNYKTQDESIQHIGPMAQDFYRLFEVGANNTTITTVDPDGIALAAAKQLALENKELKERLKKLEEVVAQLIAKK